jgi:hypothetical protein
MRLVALVLVVGCNIPVVHFMGTGGDGGDDIDAPTVDAGPPGSYVWLRSLSQVQTQTIAAGASGIMTPGYLYSSATLDGTNTLTSAGNADQVIAGFAEADGANLFAVRHGDVGSEFGLLGLVASNGLELVSGVTEGDKMIDLGLGPVAGGGTPVEDGYIGTYANGVADWVQRIVGPGSDKFLGMARGPGSTIYGAGWFEQSPTFNGGTLTSVGGRDIIVARFSLFGGAVDLMKQYGGTGRDEVGGGGIATLISDPSTFVMSGFFDDTINFGGTSTPITASHGGLDAWIAKFDNNGDGIWAVTYGGPGDDRDISVVLDPQGDVYVAGTFTTSIAFGPKMLTSVGGVDHFIAKLKGTDGSPVWAISFGSAADEHAGRLAVDDKGHLAFSGAMTGAFEGMPTLGGQDAYVAEFKTSDGSLIWQKLYSTASDDGGGGVVYGTTTGDLFASVGTGAPYDFGAPIIGDPNPLDVLIRIVP